MSEDDKDPPVRSKRDRIERLRRRLDQMKYGSDSAVIAVLKGVLDLLDDEL